MALATEEDKIEFTSTGQTLTGLNFDLHERETVGPTIFGTKPDTYFDQNGEH